jgi:hypothetical protein
MVGALSGLACIGTKRFRELAQASTDQDEREALLEIIGFIERAPKLA